MSLLKKALKEYYVLTKEQQIEYLLKDRKVFTDQAQIAYDVRDFEVENKWQKKADEITNFIDEIQKNIDQENYPIINLEQTILDLAKTHKWDTLDSLCRCNGCGMKRETFYGTMAGLRTYYENKDPYGNFIETGTCKEKFK